MSLYSFYRGTPQIRTYCVYWGRAGTPEYREIVFESDGSDVTRWAKIWSLGPLGPGYMATGNEVVRET